MPNFQNISWDQLVAGEVAIILQAKSHTQVMGRLPDEVASSLTGNSALPSEVLNMLQHASSLYDIIQHYVFPDKQDQLEFIVCDFPGDSPPLDLELPLSGQCSPLQTIFSIRAPGKSNYLEARVLV